MKTCSDACYPVCDFCKHHDFAKYWCNLKNQSAYPSDGCGDFYCRSLAKEEEKRQQEAKAMDTLTVEFARLWADENTMRKEMVRSARRMGANDARFGIKRETVFVPDEQREAYWEGFQAKRKREEDKP